MMSPSSVRAASFAAILAMSARSCFAIWALAAATVTWASCSSTRLVVAASRPVTLGVPVSSMPLLAPFLLILDCALLFCFTVLLATVLYRFCRHSCLTEVQNSTQHSRTSFLPQRSSTALRYHGDDTCSRARGFVSEPLNMMRSVHTANVHVKMTNETSM